MLRSKWLVLVLAMALSLGVASISYAADDSDSASFDIAIDNPHVAWAMNDFPDEIEVAVAPGMDRQYGVHNTIVVASLTPFNITVTGEWAGANVGGIALNIDNVAVLDAADPSYLLDFQVSARGEADDFGGAGSAPGAGTVTVFGGPNTLGEVDDAVEFGVAVWLVLVDEQNALDGNHNSSGWVDGAGLDNSRVDVLPDGDYTVTVTVTVAEVI